MREWWSEGGRCSGMVRFRRTRRPLIVDDAPGFEARVRSVALLAIGAFRARRSRTMREYGPSLLLHSFTVAAP